MERYLPPVAPDLREVVIFIDFESNGGVPSKNGFMEFGAVAKVLGTNQDISTFHGYASQNGYVPDERCSVEFWMKNDEMKARYDAIIAICETAPTSSPHQVVQNFIIWLHLLVAGLNLKNVQLATDCSTYDTGMLKAFSNIDTMYLFGEPRDIIDIGMLYYGLGRRPFTKALFDGSSKAEAVRALNEMFPNDEQITELPAKTKHTHNPVEDAMNMGERYSYVVQRLMGVPHASCM